MTDPGVGGRAGASASASGSGGAPSGGVATGGRASGEVGGSNGIALGGSNGNVGGVAQSGGGAGGIGSAGTGGATEADAGAGDAGGEVVVTYSQDIQPILVANCSPCHSTDNNGRHNAATSYADAVRVSADIVREIRTGGMPESGSGNAGCNGGDPGDPGCVSVADFELIQSWVAAGTPE